MNSAFDMIVVFKPVHVTFAPQSVQFFCSHAHTHTHSCTVMEERKRGIILQPDRLCQICSLASVDGPLVILSVIVHCLLCRESLFC